MHRGNGAIIVLAISEFYVLASFYRLIRHRFYAHFIAVLGAFLGFGLVIYLGLAWALSFEKADLRIWVAIPFVALIPVFLLSGFFVRRNVEIYVEQRLGRIRQEAPKGKLARRALGASLIAVGAGVWGYGIIKPFSSTLQIPALVIALYSVVFGVAYLLTGRRIREIDT